MISPESIQFVIEKLQQLKEVFDEYADRIDESEITLRKLQKLMSDRESIDTLRKSTAEDGTALPGPGRELEKVYSLYRGKSRRVRGRLERGRDTGISKKTVVMSKAKRSFAKEGLLCDESREKVWRVVGAEKPIGKYTQG